MIEHVVLFRWKADAEAAAITSVIEGLRGLKGEIAEIADLSCGENFSDRSKGFQTGLVVRFKSREDLEAYAVHPLHQAVITERIRPIVEEVLAVDYEF